MLLLTQANVLLFSALSRNPTVLSILSKRYTNFAKFHIHIYREKTTTYLANTGANLQIFSLSLDQSYDQNYFLIGYKLLKNSS